MSHNLSLSDCETRSTSSLTVDGCGGGGSASSGGSFDGGSTTSSVHLRVGSMRRLQRHRTSRRPRSKLPLKQLNYRYDEPTDVIPLVGWKLRLLAAMEQQISDKVQESDQKFFEGFSALPYKIDNVKKQLTSTKSSEKSEKEAYRRLSIKFGQMTKLSKSELEDLYVELLYTIRHRVGAPVEEFTPFDDDLHVYAQQAFRVDDNVHRHLMDKAQEEKPPVVLLNVCVMEARNLLSKDVNGFSDPFCMLGVVPGKRRNELTSPSAVVADRKPPIDDHTDSPSGYESGDEPKRHPSVMTRLGGSFRRKSKYKAQQERPTIEDGNGGAAEQLSIPAKVIKATSVQHVTLNPKWNEKFSIVVEDVKADRFHLDIWDHDDETSVVDAVVKLNEVKGVKGLGRFFKQVAQSARNNNDDSVDDFLGCVSLRIKDIPSTGMESWFPLEGRSAKSEVSGEIKLKLWLGTREERQGFDDDDNLIDVRQHEAIIRQFTEHELRLRAQDTATWTGRLPQAALTILHQHAIQGDLTDIQCSMCYWLAYSKIHLDMNLDYAFLYEVLERLLGKWRPTALSKDEEDLVAESLSEFLCHCYDAIVRHRDLFPAHDAPPHHAASKLNDLLRCVVLLHSSALFAKCLPFQRALSKEIPSLIKKSTIGFFERAKYTLEKERSKDDDDCAGLAYLVTVANAGCTKAASLYHEIFLGTTGTDYFVIMYREFDRLLTNSLCSSSTDLKDGPLEELTAKLDSDIPAEQQETLVAVFELHLSLNEFISYRERLPESDRAKCTLSDYSWWFTKPITKWIEISKARAFLRVDHACQLDKKIHIEGTDIQQSSSYVDVCFTLQQIIDFWDRIHVTDVKSRSVYSQRIIQTVCKVSEYYSDKLFAYLAHAGFYQEQVRKISEPVMAQFCTTLNNAEQSRRIVTDLWEKAHVDEVTQKLEAEEGIAAAAAWKSAVEQLVNSCDSCITTQMDLACSKLIDRQRDAFKKHVFHLAWSPEGCPTERAMKPLIDQLDKDLVTFHRWLLHRNFVRILLAQMVAVLELIHACVDENTGMEPSFYRRLNESTLILKEFFHAGGKGLSMESIEATHAYQRLQLRLSSSQTPSVELIEKFYADLLRAQNEATECKFGIINLRAYYNKHNRTLVVDVIGAKKVIPLDNNGLSDPFVIVEVVPKVYFRQCNATKTRVCHKTLNPTFDETKIDASLPPIALLHLVVMDHDFLVSNDFAGEAYLDLAEVPGIGNGTVASHGGHGASASALRQFNLILQHPDKYDETIISVLSTRKDDQDAQEFIRHISTVRNL